MCLRSASFHRWSEASGTATPAASGGEDSVAADSAADDSSPRQESLGRGHLRVVPHPRRPSLPKAIPTPRAHDRSPTSLLDQAPSGASQVGAFALSQTASIVLCCAGLRPHAVSFEEVTKLGATLYGGNLSVGCVATWQHLGGPQTRGRPFFVFYSADASASLWLIDVACNGWALSAVHSEACFCSRCHTAVRSRRWTARAARPPQSAAPATLQASTRSACTATSGAPSARRWTCTGRCRIRPAHCRRTSRPRPSARVRALTGCTWTDMLLRAVHPRF